MEQTPPSIRTLSTETQFKIQLKRHSGTYTAKPRAEKGQMQALMGGNPLPDLGNVLIVCTVSEADHFL